jgi:hypothetical protein
MPEDHTRPDILARIADNPDLARAVPRLAPEILHAVIAHRGLRDCGDLLALATPEQLTAIFDLDLWRTTRDGDEEFDAARFGEWLEVLADIDPAVAADRLATLDPALVVAGLSQHVAVFDPATFEPTAEPNSADPVRHAGRERGLHVEIGGYLIVSRRSAAWEAVVDVLLALDEQHPQAFHRVMHGCRRLSNSGREIDGLDDLLDEGDQVPFDLSLGRETRRERAGFLSPPQARAFLHAARHITIAGEPPPIDPVFAAYQRMANQSREPDSDIPEGADAALGNPPGDEAAAVVVDMLRDAGVLAAGPRGLLAAAPDSSAGDNTTLDACLQGCRDEAASIARGSELAFLANALMAGSSVQGRPLTRREAAAAAAATCNLGLECWPRQWPSPASDLVAAFQIGWTVLHDRVSMLVGRRLVETLDRIEPRERELHMDLHALRRALQGHLQADTPWLVRDRLDVLASLDLPVWAAIVGLLDDCPVLLSNVSASAVRRPRTIDPAAFQFIATLDHIAAVRTFVDSLAGALAGC